jgi:hypothetical protein
VSVYAWKRTPYEADLPAPAATAETVLLLRSAEGELTAAAGMLRPSELLLLLLSRLASLSSSAAVSSSLLDSCFSARAELQSLVLLVLLKLQLASPLQRSASTSRGDPGSLPLQLPLSSPPSLLSRLLLLLLCLLLLLLLLPLPLSLLLPASTASGGRCVSREAGSAASSGPT